MQMFTCTWTLVETECIMWGWKCTMLCYDLVNSRMCVWDFPNAIWKRTAPRPNSQLCLGCVISRKPGLALRTMSWPRSGTVGRSDKLGLFIHGHRDGRDQASHQEYIVCSYTRSQSRVWERGPSFPLWGLAFAGWVWANLIVRGLKTQFSVICMLNWTVALQTGN